MNEPEILYHYCSTSTFLSIIKNKEIWLSSLNMTNDSTEGKLVRKIINKLLEEQKIGFREQIRINMEFNNIEKDFVDLGICFSKNGDLLSQWRAYADDGQGVSIGFRKAVLSQENGLSIDPVIYDRAIQKEKVGEIINEVINQFKSESYNLGVGLLQSPEKIDAGNSAREQAWTIFSKNTIDLIPILFTLKHQAFQEEEEYRLHGYMNTDKNGYNFYTRRDTLVPYRAEKITDLSISKIILGPKHKTPIDIVQRFLIKHGFDHVYVEPSVAPYR